MGVQTRIALYASDESTATHAAAEAFDVIGRLDAMMSDYRADSELSQLPRLAVDRSTSVPDDLFHVLDFSQRVALQSDGAFDVTIGPLVAQWRKARQSGVLPTHTERDAAMNRVGWRLLHVDSSTRTVRLESEAMRLDLGGVAKGYAAQRAVDQLSAHGFSRCLVALAGDVVAGDPPPDQNGWVVEMPHAEDGEHPRRIILANAAISTSGDTEQFITIDGIRYSHIVDPRTGLGMTDHRTVSVIAPRGEVADAMSTALCVLGRDGVNRLIQHYPGTAVIIRDDQSQPLIHDPDNRINWLRSITRSPNHN